MPPSFQNLVTSFFAPFQNEAFLSTLALIWTFAPIWAPILFGALFWYLWKNYVLILFLSKQKATLLELKIPPEVYKTPMAMELVLNSIHLTFGETTFVDKFFHGKRRTFLTFEIVSLGGEIRFFIYTRAFFRNQIEAAFYAQYPEIEIHEAEDYSLPFEYVPDKSNVWACEFMKQNKVDAYPIKTYIDYGLDSTVTKEEQKVDPMTIVLETLAVCRPGNNLWIQILFQGHRKDKIKAGTLFQKVDWTDDGKRELDKILQRGGQAKLSPAGFPILPQLSKEEQEKATALERNMSKLAFNVGIRGLYVCEDMAVFNAVHIVGLLNSMKQFNAGGKNSLAPGRFHASRDWPWEDFRGMRDRKDARKALEYYKRRAYFHPPYQQKPSVMSTEELATLFHIPGTAATTPTLPRLTSRRAEPPSNLPI
jgi:hypothetical protein